MFWDKKSLFLDKTSRNINPNINKSDKKHMFLDKKHMFLDKIYMFLDKPHQSYIDGMTKQQRKVYDSMRGIDGNAAEKWKELCKTSK